MRAKKKKYKIKARAYILLALLLIITAVIAVSCSRKASVPEPMDGPGMEKPVPPEGGDEGPETGESGESKDPETPKRPTSTTPEDAYPLSVPDDDILVLVNKTHPVSADYEADDLVTVRSCDPSVGNDKTKMMRKAAADAVEELIAGAKDAGYDIVMRTGYRSYSYQESLFNSYVKNNGEEAANKFSARPGESEHQTGLCCDLGRIGYSLTSFDDSKEAVWVAENCHKYGFILRYPEGKTDVTGYIYESWHIRYVGKEAAEIIHNENLTLEEYLGRL